MIKRSVQSDEAIILKQYSHKKGGLGDAKEVSGPGLKVYSRKKKENEKNELAKDKGGETKGFLTNSN